jgi:cobalt-zinc-cadmium efflux system membrane fusion protein
VFAALAGVALWGHSTDWTLPKFSALFGGSASASGQCEPGAEGWCKEHNVPESECIECNTNLIPAQHDYGWCPEHGISQCPLHHPDVAQLKTIPSVTDDDLQRASRALAILPRAENNSHCKKYQKRIQFASQEAVDKAGIDIAVVDQAPMVEAIAANGEIVYDETHTARMASRVAGTVWRVEKHPGDPVRKGDVLALVDSADVGRAKEELLQQLAQVRLKQGNVDRLQPLAISGAIAGQQMREAQATLQESQIKLLGAQQTLMNLGLPVRIEDFAQQPTDQIARQIQFLGLPASIIASFDGDSVSSNLYLLRSPLDGVVVDCKIVSGETVDPGAMLFCVTDLRKMWLMLDVRQEDSRYLSLQQRVLFRPTDSPEIAQIEGSIAWISTAADDKTRTVKVRVDLPNAEGRLRANVFGTGRIVLREEPRATVVPTEAIHSDGDCNIIFVRDKDYLHEGAPKFFHVREVRLGTRKDDVTEIIAGLLPGEVIAAKNSVVLEAQLLKSNLGEGCACCAAAKKKEK